MGGVWKDVDEESHFSFSLVTGWKGGGPSGGRIKEAHLGLVLPGGWGMAKITLEASSDSRQMEA